MSRPLLFVVSVLALLAGPNPAASALIQPDTAVASSDAGSPYVAENTIDGSGLPANFTPADSHAQYSNASGGNHWTSNGANPTDQSIVWGFTTPQTLGSIYIWNHQSSTLSANPNYDVRLFDLTFLDAANAVLLFLDDLELAQNTPTGQTFTFGPLANVSSVQLDIESTWGSTAWTGLAEVAFETTVIGQVPEPATLALTGLGLVGIGLARRRRRA